LPVGRAVLGGSPYLGVYFRVSERTALVPPSTPVPLLRDLERLLGVTTVRTTLGDSDILGALVAMNSRGAVVGTDPEDDEARNFHEVVSVRRIVSRQNALGNNVLANDHGAVVHPDFSDEAVREIASALSVPAERGTVAGLGTVGMAAIATNKGVVVHPRATEVEAQHLATVLQVPVHRSTANFGVPIVGACIVANSRGFFAGRPTTPVEFVHLQEGLGIFD
jgi:translation initiation factor 6